MSVVLNKLKMRLPAIVLLVATLFFWGRYNRYESAGPLFLNIPDLSEASSFRGECMEANGSFKLVVSPGGKTAGVRFSIPEATEHELLRVCGRIRTDGVERGKSSWRCARLILVQYGSDGKWIPKPHVVGIVDGTQGWRGYEKVFKVSPEAVRVDVAVEQMGSAGIAEFDSLMAEPVQLRSSFVYWRIFFATAWLFTGVFYFRRARLHERKLKLLILLNIIAILAGTLLPGEWIDASIGSAKSVVAHSVRQAEQSFSMKASGVIAKEEERDTQRIEWFESLVVQFHRAGHFMLFAALGFLLFLSAFLERRQGSFYLYISFDILLFAAVTESLQYLTFDREAGIGDWFNDVLGLLAVLALCVPVIFFRRWKDGTSA